MNGNINLSFRHCLFAALFGLIWTSCPVRADTAVQLVAPATLGQQPKPPEMVEDPHRPQGAPPAAAIQSLIEEDGPDAGVTLATKGLRLSEMAYGSEDARTIIPRLNLAHASQQAGDSAQALRSYRKVIAMAEAVGGPRDSRLIDAWAGIGYANLVAGQVRSAQAAYEAALQLGRINLGLHNAAQIALLHSLALAQHADGKTAEADESQARRLEVSERINGLGSPEAARLYISVGRWFRETGKVSQAVSLHALAVEILGSSNTNEPELLEALIEAAISGGRRDLGFEQAPLPRNARPKEALERALTIVGQQTQLKPERRARALIRIADVHFEQGRRGEALDIYMKASAMLTKAGEKPPFDQPALILFEQPVVDPVEGSGGFVVAQFDVSDRGQVKRLEILEKESISVPRSATLALRRALRGAKLRPRIQNGALVETRKVQFRLAVRGGSA